MNEWSDSRFNTITECLRAAYLAYLYPECHDGEKLPRVRSPAGESGSWVHKGLERLGNHCRRLGVRSDVQMGRSIAADIYQHCRDAGVVMEGLAEHWQWNLAAIYKEGVGIEQYIAAPLPGDRGQFRARVDLLEWDPGTACLTLRDYKSWWMVPTHDPDRTPRQLLRYAWACRNALPFRNAIKQIMVQYVWVRYVGVRDNPIHEWEVPLQDDDTEADLCGRADEMNEKIKEWKTARRRLKKDTSREACDRDHWPATPGRRCTICDLVPHCYAAEANNDRLCIFTDEDARRLAERLVALEANVKAHKALLRPWLEQNPPVQVGDRALGFHLPSTAPVMCEDPRKFWKFLEREGLEAYKFFLPNIELMRMLWERSEEEWVGKSIRHFIEGAASTYFDWRAVAEPDFDDADTDGNVSQLQV